MEKLEYKKNLNVLLSCSSILIGSNLLKKDTIKKIESNNMLLNQEISELNYNKYCYFFSELTYSIFSEIFNQYKNITNNEDKIKNFSICSNLLKLLKLSSILFYQMCTELFGSLPIDNLNRRNQIIFERKIRDDLYSCKHSDVYVEDEYFKNLMAICRVSEENTKKTSTICVEAVHIQNLKHTIDNLEENEKKKELYYSYLKTSDNFIFLLTRLLGKHYFNLLGSTVNVCFERFLDQQIQIKLIFEKKRLEILLETPLKTPVISF